MRKSRLLSLVVLLICLIIGITTQFTLVSAQTDFTPTSVSDDEPVTTIVYLPLALRNVAGPQPTPVSVTVFEGFFRPICGLCQSATQVIRDQLVPEYATAPVLFLEYDIDAHNPRNSRWYEGYTSSETVWLPETMVDSGDQVQTGMAYLSPGGFYDAFKAMIDTSLAASAARADILTIAYRNDNRVSADIEVVNRGSITLGSGNNATVWFMVYEQFDNAPLADRLTNQYVRAVAFRSITNDLAPGMSQTFSLDTDDLSGVVWENLHAVVIVDYRPDPSADPYKTYQATLADIYSTLP